MKRSIGLSACAAIATIALASCAATNGGWNQWGGPDRDFSVQTTGLADSWPDDGPRKIWHRELGDGYSTIVAEGNRLYTMYRNGDTEYAVALDASTGKTIWEQANPSPPSAQMRQFGAGPHATPLIVGDRLYTVGTNMMLQCLNRSSGKLIWKHDLVEEFGAEVPGYGYACSPLAYKNLIILPFGGNRDDAGQGRALIAFHLRTGELVWKSENRRTGYASPILIDFDGEPQVVQLLSDGVMGVNPNDGELLWHYEFEQDGNNICTPVWTGDLLFLSSSSGGGSRALKLVRRDGNIVPEELWYTRKMRMYHGNVVRIGDYVYGASGERAPALFTALNLNTGKVTWRERGFTKSTCVRGDDKVIVLGENGQLYLTRCTPEALTILSQCKIAEPSAWAGPTLVGKTLYLRDRKHIMALDVG